LEEEEDKGEKEEEEKDGGYEGMKKLFWTICEEFWEVGTKPKDGLKDGLKDGADGDNEDKVIDGGNNDEDW
jgi:hypothetical protein